VKLTFNGSNLQYINEQMISEFKRVGDVDLTIKKHSNKRTLDANAQQWVWFAKIGKFYGVETKVAAKMCKLDFGLAILLGDPNFGPKISYVLGKVGFWDMNREQQLNAIDLFQVTSLFNTKQHNLYRDQIQNYWGRNGVSLNYQGEGNETQS
jgi:hypothetical protein